MFILYVSMFLYQFYATLIHILALHLFFLQTPSVLPGSSGGKRKLASGNAHMVHPQSAPRALQEYQFLPEQPSVRSDTYERADPSHFYSSQHDGHSGRASSLSAGGSHLHGKEQVPTGYGQGTSASLQSQQGRISHVLGEYDRMDVQVGLENPLLLCDRRMSNEDEAARLERKRKVSYISPNYLQILFSSEQKINFYVI